MCRTNGRTPQGGHARRTAQPRGTNRQDDLLGYVALRDLASAVEGQMSVDYWKSAPYFVNFSDGYQFATGCRPPVRAEARAGCTAAAPHPAPQRRGHPPLRTARLRQRAAAPPRRRDRRRRLVEAAVAPFVLPYLTPPARTPNRSPRGHEAARVLLLERDPDRRRVPAQLRSRPAHRRRHPAHRAHPPARRSIASRLAYTWRQRPQAMTTLALFWPMPGLAALADPLAQGAFARAASASPSRRSPTYSPASYPGMRRAGTPAKPGTGPLPCPGPTRSATTPLTASRWSRRSPGSPTQTRTPKSMRAAWPPTWTPPRCPRR